jgi:hypothetical protein
MADQDVPLPPMSLDLVTHRRTDRSLYIDAGTGESKLLVYSANTQIRPEVDPLFGIADMTNLFRMDAVCELGPIATCPEVEALAKSFVERSHNNFVNRTFLGATEWYRRRDPCAPANPTMECFLSDIRLGGIELVELTGKEEAFYEFKAVEFALTRVRAAQHQGLVEAPDLSKFAMYVSAGGGSLQFANTRCMDSIPILVKDYTTKLGADPSDGDTLDGWMRYLDGQAHIFKKTCPRIEEGIVVCMGSMFYSAKTIAMDNADDAFHLVSVFDALAAMDTYLEEFELEGATARSIRGYVAMCVNREFLRATCGPGVQLLFKRNWKVHTSTFRTTWTFGHFLTTLEGQGATK